LIFLSEVLSTDLMNTFLGTLCTSLNAKIEVNPFEWHHVYNQAMFAYAFDPWKS